MKCNKFHQYFSVFHFKVYSKQIYTLMLLNIFICNKTKHLFFCILVMRTQGSLRLILNTKIWPGMTVERASQKSVRVTGTDGDHVKVFLIIVSL